MSIGALHITRHQASCAGIRGEPCDCGVLETVIQKRRTARFDAIDSMSVELRELVNDYSYNVVNEFINCGVREPRHIRHLVGRVLDAFSPTRGCSSAQGGRTFIARRMTAANPVDCDEASSVALSATD